MIHPSAVIDPRAILGQEVSIGPYCVVGAGVELGDRAKLHHHVSLQGPSKIGADNEFFPFVSIGARTQDLKYAGEPTYLEIGQENVFREFVTVHRSDTAESCTRIGSRGNFLAYSHIAHDCQVGDEVVFSNGATLGGHVSVGDHAILGGLSGVHQFCRIGAHAMVGGCTKIVKDIAPFVIADGNPAKVRGINQTGLSRRGFSPLRIKALQKAYRCYWKEEGSKDEALGQLAQLEALQSSEEPAVQGDLRELVRFLQGSQRGITP